MGKIIVVEDNLVFSGYVCGMLESKGYRTAGASDCKGARKLFANIGEDDMVLSDLRLPDGDGIALLEELRKQGRNNPYIVMTDYDEVPTAVKSMKMGAEDYIPKKLLTDNLFPLLNTLQKRLERHGAPIHERMSEPFRKLYNRIRLVAPTNMSVLILGESGTGKEHIAEKIHKRSKRADKPFVPVNCGILSKELAASALFGHERGAYTGAESKRQGYWAEADGGTLFLDEIGNLPMEVQQMLLRALESKLYRPIGGDKDKRADVRIIAATNEDLPATIADKRFRSDLYQRLKEYTLHIPPLRECRDDILPLAGFFLKLTNVEFDRQVKGFDTEAEKKMLAHTWTGNVRELKRIVRMAVLHTEGDTLMADTLEFDEQLHDAASDFDEREKQLNRERILHALQQSGGNKRKAAELLGVSPATFYKKLDKYGVKT